MNDLAERIAHAREAVAPRWTDARARAVHARVVEARGSWALPSSRSLGLVGCAAVALFAWKTARSHTPTPTVSVDPRVVRFDDGSRATLRDHESAVQATEVTASRVTVDLLRGAARFDVVRAPQRVFRVEAGEVRVEVLGTVFDVSREADQRHARVHVDRGTVRVSWARGEALLHAGDAGLFPREEPPVAVAPTPTTTVPSPTTPASPASAPRSTWRALARAGDYDAAYEALHREGRRAVHDDPEELLLAADVARLGHHPEQAVEPLRRVLSAFASDPRAPLAAFTLGRVQLDQLGRPREAAEAFARAAEHPQGASLAEDALAREVEAWSRAGERERARQRAEVYASRFPQGRRARAVRRYGELDAP